MDTAATAKKGRIEPRLVICSGGNQSVDDAVKALIDEWLVPCLVKEYVLLLQAETKVQTSRSDLGVGAIDD